MCMDSHRCYREIVGYKPVDGSWVYYKGMCNRCIQDIEMVSVSYDYCDGDIRNYGHEEMSIERFLQLKSHTYMLTGEDGNKEYVTFMCRDDRHRALSKMFREFYERQGYTVKPVSKKAEGVSYLGKNCKINQFWNGDLEIVLYDFVGTVIKLNGLQVLSMIYQLLSTDLMVLGLKLVSKEGYSRKYEYKNGKVIMVTKENIKDLMNKQKTVLRVVE